MRFRDTAFSLALCALLAAPCALYASDKLGLELPSWLTADDAYYLEGGIVNAHLSENISLAGFRSGALQEALEGEVGNYIPCKAAALLGNAALQRAFIGASNVAFQWAAYPAFYGCEYAVMPGDGRMMAFPQASNTEHAALAEEVSEGLGDASERWPDKRFFGYLATDSHYVEDSPLHSLASNGVTYDQIQDSLAMSAQEITWVDGSVTYDEFNEMWYKTDHHWKTQGAYLAYQRLANAMGIPDGDRVPPDFETIEAPLFRGTFARSGLDSDYADEVSYVPTSYFDSLVVEVKGEERSPESLVHREKYAAGNWDDDPFANHYGEFFHGDYGLMSISDPESKANGSLLIVADSYSNCMEYFFAGSFEKVYVCDPRHYDGTLDTILNEYPGVDDVLFLMRDAEFVSKETLAFLLE